MRVFGKGKSGDMMCAEVDIIWSRIFEVNGRLFLILFFPEDGKSKYQKYHRSPAYIFTSEYFEGSIYSSRSGKVDEQSINATVLEYFTKGYIEIDYAKAEKTGCHSFGMSRDEYLTECYIEIVKNKLEEEGK